MASEDLIKAEVAAMAEARKLELAKSVAARITQLEAAVTEAFDRIETNRALITKGYALDLNDSKSVGDYLLQASSTFNINGQPIYLRTN